ncbi:MAG TPA: tetratricopeptide repeat protein [Candidatus Lokiarchaeia archaeon]|nr:tetratricopeptide repeat protein [Candidatus Lokiarchaeia archaeon]
MDEDKTAEYWFDLGKYHSELKNMRSAMECYRKAINIDPYFQPAWVNLGAEFFQQKKYQESIECCQRAIRIRIDDDIPWLTMAANYFELNDDGKSLFCFQKAADLGSEKAIAFLQNARKLHDKLIDAEPVDVTDEIFPKPVTVQPPEEVSNEKVHREKIPIFEGSDHGRYIDKLAGFLLEEGNSLKDDTGGIISFIELFSRLKNEYPSFNGTPGDVLKALERLEKKRLIVGIKELEGSNLKVVEFVPGDLTADPQQVLGIAAIKGMLTIEEIMSETGWEDFRVARVLDVLEQKGIARKSTTYLTGTRWYFPGLKLNLIGQN